MACSFLKYVVSDHLRWGNVPVNQNKLRMGCIWNAEPTLNLPEPPGTLTENRNNKNQIKAKKEQNQNNKNQIKISSFRLKKATTVRHMTNGVRILSWPEQKKRGSKRRFIKPLTAVGALRVLSDFTLSNARRFYSSMENPLAGKGLTASKTH